LWSIDGAVSNRHTAMFRQSTACRNIAGLTAFAGIVWNLYEAGKRLVFYLFPLILNPYMRIDNP